MRFSKLADGFSHIDRRPLRSADLPPLSRNGSGLTVGVFGFPRHEVYDVFVPEFGCLANDLENNHRGKGISWRVMSPASS